MADRWRSLNPAAVKLWADRTIITPPIGMDFAEMEARVAATVVGERIHDDIERSMYDMMKYGTGRFKVDVPQYITQAREYARRALNEVGLLNKPKERPGFIGEPETVRFVVANPRTIKPKAKVFPGTVRALVNPVMSTGALVYGDTDTTGGWREDAYSQRGKWRGDPTPFDYYR